METLTQFLIDWGYWGLFFSALIAGSIVPFSSEAVMLVLVHMGLDPVLGVKEKQLDKARRFLAGRGAMMAFFSFLPTIGEAIAIVLGLMRSNVWLTGGAMLAGKTLRYIVVLATFRGALSLF